MSTRARRAVNPAAAIGLLAIATTCGAEYDADDQRGLAECTAIPASASASQSGLRLNRDGVGAYCERSACLRRHAVRTRDDGLCAQVRRKIALSSARWGVS